MLDAIARLVLPALLAKDLVELAARPRTYVLRVLYAVSMATLFLSMAAGPLTTLSTGDLSALGAGRQLFDDLVSWQFYALYLFLPLLIAPAVSEEEERGNLDILIVSGIGPFEFLLQKLVSRLIGMGTLMLLALPLGGIAYTLGGVDARQLFAAAISLCVACLQIGAWAIWCSARERTTLAAVKSTYLAGIGWSLVAAPLLSLPLWLVIALMNQFQGLEPSADLATGWLKDLSFYPFTLYGQSCARHDPPWRVLMNSSLILLSSAFALWRATGAMRIRSSTMSRQMQEQMKLYRNEFRYERHRRAQLIKTGRDVEALPEHHPLAWREQRRMRLYRWSERLVHAWIGTRIIIGLLLAGFVWLSYLITVDNHLNLRSSATEWECFPWLALTLLLIGSVATVITASGLFAGERSRRSMDLLLVLPMSTTALIAEKLSGCILVTRLMTAFIAISIISACTAEIRLGQPLIALVAGPLAVLTAWVCLQLLTWIAVAVSLRVQDQVRAAIIACAVILCWCILPPVGIALLNGNAAVPAPLLWCASLLCPVPTVLDTTTAEPLWQLRLVANLAVCSTLLWVVRRNCLRQADRLLGRQP